MATSSLHLFRAIHHDDQAAAKRALHLNPALVHSKHPKHMHTPLHSAAAIGNVQVLKELLHLGASCQACDRNSDTPLHVAARQGHAAVVKELLTDAGKRSCLKHFNNNGATPLHLAVAAGHTEVVQLLLNAGARADVKDRAGRMPLDLIDTNNKRLAEILTQRRQLTPNTSGRTRRFISPGVSPTPCQDVASSTSPDRPAPGSQHTQQEQLIVPSTTSGPDNRIEANISAASNHEAVAGAMPVSLKHVQHDTDPDQSEDHARQCDQQAPKAVDEQQTLEHTAQQSWLQFSPQRPSGGAFSQHDLVETIVPDASTCNVHQQQPATRHNTAATPFSTQQLQLTQMQSHQQQKRLSQESSMSVGPLHSARMPGHPSSSAVARASDQLTQGGQLATVSQRIMQQESDTLLAGGMSHIVSPEASAGLLGGVQHGYRNEQPLSGGLRQQHSALQQYDSFDSVSSAWASCRRSHNHLTNGQQAQLQQQQQFAALSAAVSAKARVGPLQLPMHSQLTELTSKVSQLEEWFEAQVELIPEWQKVLVVVQAVKRQVEDQHLKLNQVDASLQGQCGAMEHVSSVVAALKGSQANAANHLLQLDGNHKSMQCSLTELNERICHLEAQLLEQVSSTTAQLSSSEAQVRAVHGDLSAAISRVSTVEAALQSFEAELLKLQLHVTPSDGDTAATASHARLEALESDVAVLRQMLLDMQQRPPATSHQETDQGYVQHALLLQEGTQIAQPSVVAMTEHSMLAKEVHELQQRVSDLSSVCGVVGNLSLQEGAMEETILPFMETTSICLQQHEDQLTAIQAIVPKLEGVVSQRAQMCELAQQVAALQTALSLIAGGGKETSGGRLAAGVLPTGPLSAQKAAVDLLAMATNMVKLQCQMGALSASVEQLQLEWNDAAAASKADNDAIKSAWEAERVRMSASEREAVRRLAEQQRELKAREEKLLEIRELALTEEVARRSQLDSEARVAAALDEMQEQQQLLQGSVNSLTTDLEIVKEHMTSLQDEARDSIMRFDPIIAKVEELGKRTEAAESATSRAAAAATVADTSGAAAPAPAHGVLPPPAALLACSGMLGAMAGALVTDRGGECGTAAQQASSLEATSSAAAALDGLNDSCALSSLAINPFTETATGSSPAVPDVRPPSQGVTIIDYMQTQQQAAGPKATAETLPCADPAPDSPADAFMAECGELIADPVGCVGINAGSKAPVAEEQTMQPTSVTTPAGKVSTRFAWLGCNSRRVGTAGQVLADRATFVATPWAKREEVCSQTCGSTTTTAAPADARKLGRWQKALRSLTSGSSKA